MYTSGIFLLHYKINYIMMKFISIGQNGYFAIWENEIIIKSDNDHLKRQIKSNGFRQVSRNIYEYKDSVMLHWMVKTYLYFEENKLTLSSGPSIFAVFCQIFVTILGVVTFNISIFMEYDWFALLIPIAFGIQLIGMNYYNHYSFRKYILKPYQRRQES